MIGGWVRFPVNSQASEIHVNLVKLSDGISHLLCFALSQHPAELHEIMSSARRLDKAKGRGKQG